MSSQRDLNYVQIKYEKSNIAIAEINIMIIIIIIIMMMMMIKSNLFNFARGQQ